MATGTTTQDARSRRWSCAYPILAIEEAVVVLLRTRCPSAGRLFFDIGSSKNLAPSTIDLRLDGVGLLTKPPRAALDRYAKRNGLT
jgi:hypothetical protein